MKGDMRVSLAMIPPKLWMIQLNENFLLFQKINYVN
jgi:hypothetical protein